MPKFGKRSFEKLETCHPSIQEVMIEAIKSGPDFTIICGHRNESDQNNAYYNGNTQLLFPRSKHNKMPSMAIDIAPYPIDWDKIPSFIYLAGYVMGVADKLGIKLRWGGDWNQNYDQSDERFRDFPHFELVKG